LREFKVNDYTSTWSLVIYVNSYVFYNWVYVWKKGYEGNGHFYSLVRTKEIIVKHSPLPQLYHHSPYQVLFLFLV